MKTRPNLKRPLFFIIFLLCLAAVIGISVHRARTGDARYRTRFQKTFSAYIAPFDSYKDWWLLQTPPAGEESADQIATALTNVMRAVEGARSLGPLTESITARFTNFFTSVFENGASRISMRGNIDMESLRGKTEICFFSREEAMERRFPPLFYREDWSAVMIAGLKWKDPLFTAVLMHELGHAERHAIRHIAHSRSSREWFHEEIELHELEAKVLNKKTAGKYFEVVNGIIASHRRVKRPEKLLGMLSTNAFFQLDQSIGLIEEGSSIRKISVSQHTLTVGFACIDQNGGTLDDKIRFYKWASSR